MADNIKRYHIKWLTLYSNSNEEQKSIFDKMFNSNLALQLEGGSTNVLASFIVV
jgi:hypothetical protein